MKRCLSALMLLLFLLLSACRTDERTGDCLLYFPNASYLEGSAMGTEPISLSEGSVPVETLIAALLDGPSSADLTSPFPTGVTLHSWRLNDGVLRINLSEQYSALSGIQLTLANASFVLTLCQLDEVEGVSITVPNDPFPDRYQQILTVQDLLLPTA